MEARMHRRLYLPLVMLTISTWLGFAVWAPGAGATSTLFNNNCSICHGSSASIAPYPDTTCAGCHAHGTHPNSGKNTMNVSATPDSTSYSPGATISVNITGGYRSGWVRVQMWDLNCAVANTCTQSNVLASESLYTSGTTVTFPGPVTLTATAPSTPGDYTWYAGWYGNAFDINGAATGLFIADSTNSGHGNELVAVNFTVAAGSETNCNDGIDNDQNGFTDCLDPACSGVTFGACDTGNPGICSGGTLTCDGTATTAVCVQDQAAGTEGPAGNATCSDGIDNDCDGLTDTSDPDCIAGSEICDNTIDDNGDGRIDCMDPQCEGVTFGVCDTGNQGVCSGGTLTCDGTSVDPFCVQDQAAGIEGPADSPTCTDGVDNDCDGLTDADDPGCEQLGDFIPPGNDVQVTPVAGVDLSFTQITVGGVLTVNEVANPTAPAGYSIVGADYDIDFTGTTSGPVAVCLAYDETAVNSAEQELRLFHRDATGQWQDITTGVDPDANTVCGETTSFSEFTVAQPRVGGGDNSGCFIATAAYGSYWETHVKTLRTFRDAYLLTNKAGAAFVAAYYRYSPAIADYIAEHDAMRALVRVGLAPLVGFSWLAVNYGMVLALTALFGMLTLAAGTACFILRNNKD